MEDLEEEESIRKGGSEGLGNGDGEDFLNKEGEGGLMENEGEGEAVHETLEALEEIQARHPAYMKIKMINDLELY